MISPWTAVGGRKTSTAGRPPNSVATTSGPVRLASIRFPRSSPGRRSTLWEDFQRCHFLISTKKSLTLSLSITDHIISVVKIKKNRPRACRATLSVGFRSFPSVTTSVPYFSKTVCPIKFKIIFLESLYKALLSRFFHIF
ncbi:hypothetical protein PYW07_010718 [Mythimna separata]|uniref:Uncharacterized protein n=1 Tax=Mythimna separata TaxID=271217 RepID=A0AAD7Y7W2_MYTSE|nr:hypothetical protein PYW07_010718 [Mythimna separata]